MDIKPEDLTEDGFQEQLKQQAPEKDQETWKARAQGIWNQHKEYIPEYQERIQAANQLPDKQEMDHLFQMEKGTQEQLKKLLNRLSEKPEVYSETIGDIVFLLRKYLDPLFKKLPALGISQPSTPSEWYLLQNLLKEKISYTIEQPQQADEEEVEAPVNYSRRAFIALALGTVIGSLIIKNGKTSSTPDKTSPTPKPTIKPEITPVTIQTIETDLLYPERGSALSANTSLALRSTDLQFQPLINELNTLRQNGLRKVKEWQPLVDNGNIMLFYPDAENTVENFLKSFPRLIRTTPENLRILSIVCTDGTKRRDGQEILFDACFEIVSGEKHYILVEDISVQNAIPEDRIIAPYKIFELKKDGQLDLTLIVQRNEHINSHLLQISGKVGTKTISAQASLRADLVDETSEIVGIVSGILMMNR
jgi:hypothetical protein